MRVTVLYRTREHFAESYSVQPNNLNPRHYELVCHLEEPAWDEALPFNDSPPNPKAVLEEVFEVMNVKWGDAQTEVPLHLKCRSLSVGDVVIVMGKPWLCAVVGWQEVMSPTLAKLGRGAAPVVHMHHGGVLRTEPEDA